jgi:CRP-like cAMP-binding protein
MTKSLGKLHRQHRLLAWRQLDGVDRKLGEAIAQRLRKIGSTEKRPGRLLLLLANFGKEGRPEPIMAKISQEVLAEMIGTTRSRVSHFMNKFRELGFIDYNGHLEVHSSLLSVALNEQVRTVAGKA